MSNSFLKMPNFRLNSKTFANILLISRQKFTNRDVRIHINNTEIIELPLIVVTSISPVFAQHLLSDPTITDFYLNTNSFLGGCKVNLLRKIESLLNNEEIELSDEECDDLAIFGKAINNKSFTKPFTKICEELESTISVENVIDLLQKKMSYGFSPNECQKEIKFIAKHFFQVKTKLNTLPKDETLLIFLQHIIKCNDLKLESEDELVNFILQLCEHNKQFILLFDHVLLEYCTHSSIQNLLTFIETQLCSDQSLLTIIKCMSRRLLQETLPMKDK